MAIDPACRNGRGAWFRRYLDRDHQRQIRTMNGHVNLHENFPGEVFDFVNKVYGERVYCKNMPLILIHHGIHI